MEKGIALVTLAINLADSLSLAFRLIRIRQGAPPDSYERSEFGCIPFSAPWLDLYRGVVLKEAFPVVSVLCIVRIAEGFFAGRLFGECTVGRPLGEWIIDWPCRRGKSARRHEKQWQWQKSIKTLDFVRGT